MLSSRSALRSNNLQDASSDPVAKASPLGKNLLVSCVIAGEGEKLTGRH